MKPSRHAISRSKHPGRSTIPQRVSLVTQVAAILAQRIGAGEWQEMLPTEARLCQELEVSRKTVRAAFEQLERSGQIQHGPGGRKLIAPRRKASHDRHQIQKVVLLGSKPASHMEQKITWVLENLQKNLHHAGLEFESVFLPGMGRKDCSRMLRRLVRQSPAAVWLLLGVQDETQSWFHEQDTPALVWGSSSGAPALPWVDIDCAAIMQHAVHLLMANGHRRLVLFRPDTTFWGDRLSEESFLGTVARDTHGATARVVRHDATPAGIGRALQGMFSGKSHPTAIVILYPFHVMSVMGHLARLGLRVPQDVSVICRDDEPFLAFAVPSLARYSWDPQLMARKLSHLAIQLAQGEVVRARPMPITSKFISGESVAALESAAS